MIEIKADGFRCQVMADRQRRVVRTRGHDLAERLPELSWLSHLGADVISTAN